MAPYIARRLMLTLPLLVVVSFITFLLVRLSPMDPAEVVLRAQETPQITEELLAETREKLGMNDPFLLQYANWLMSCLRLNFGESFVSGQPVWSLIGPALVNTLVLTLISSFVIIVLSTLLGVVSAMREGRLIDKSTRGVSFFLTAIPSYGLASVLIWLVSVKLDLLPTSGMDSAASFVLPVTVIAVAYVGIYFRSVRSSVLTNKNEEYVLYARASGLSEGTITLRILRNSLQVAVSIFGMSIPIILGSTVVIENVFAWPGLGRLILKAILGQDFPVIQAYVLIMATAFVIINMVSDIVNAAINPKLRSERT
ncbi:nickel/cobalt ABC transporter permease [Paenibacillus sp. PL2-23]|uniref:nickel/cobalt ABC transporter permease n=1 Tax=Paenibacillus sp. PL2-23 TaxID=2100729 RepID=UPI0030FAF634